MNKIFSENPDKRPTNKPLVPITNSKYGISSTSSIGSEVLPEMAETTGGILCISLCCSKACSSSCSGGSGSAQMIKEEINL